MSDNPEQDRIENELARTRARMDGRLSELQERLTPGQILDDLMGYFRSSDGGDFARNLMDNVKSNPIPAALTGIGLTWLMASNPHPAPTSRRSWTTRNEFDRHIRAAEETVARGADEPETTYQARLDDTRARTLGLVRDARDTAESFGKRVQDALTSARENLSESVADLSSRASNTAHLVGDAAREHMGEGGQAAQQMMSKVFASVTDSPVMLGVLSFGVGAMLGAVVPQSSQEEQVLGDVARQAREGATDLAREALERGKNVARQVVEAGQDGASQHFGDQSVGEMVDDALKGDLAGRVNKMAAQVMDAGESAIRKEGLGQDKTDFAQERSSLTPRP